MAGAEVGLELRAVRFHRSGRYVAAFETVDCRGRRRAWVSEESAETAAPSWAAGGGARVDVGACAGEVRLAFFRDAGALARDPRGLLAGARPECRCSFVVLEADLEAATASGQLRSLPLLAADSGQAAAWQEMGAATVALVPPTLAHAALMPVEDLQPTGPLERGKWEPEEVLTRLRGIGRAKRDEVRCLAQRMERMQRALDALERRRGALESERRQLLEESESQERELKRLREPDVTDLDADLLLAAPGGARRAELLLLTAEERWRRARESVIAQWQEFQQISGEMDKTKQVVARYKELEAVHAEQRRVVEATRRRYAQLGEARQAVENRERMIKTLERRLHEAGARRAEHPAGSAIGAKFELLQEQGLHEVLKEAAAQLEHRDTRAGAAPASGAAAPRRKDLARRLQGGTELVLQLLDEVQRLQLDLARGPPRAAAAAAPARAAARADEEAAQGHLELRAEELQRRCRALDAERQRHAAAAARELAGLKAALAEREAREALLERQVQSARPAPGGVT